MSASTPQIQHGCMFPTPIVICLRVCEQCRGHAPGSATRAMVTGCMSGLAPLRPGGRRDGEDGQQAASSGEAPHHTVVVHQDACDEGGGGSGWQVRCFAARNKTGGDISESPAGLGSGADDRLCDVGIVRANQRTCHIQTPLSPLEIQISDNPFGKCSNFKKVIR